MISQELRIEISTHYPLLEVTAEVMLGDVPALIVYGPATQAVVRDQADLRRWFSDCRRDREPPHATSPAAPRKQQRMLL